MKKVHFIGIGGIGVSSLAQYYAATGWQVSGCDAVKSEITEGLQKQDIRVHIGHDAKHIKSRDDLVVYTIAIPDSNPELQAVRSMGIRARTYAEALGELTQEYYTVAVSGSHGKSTTTALIGLVLTAARLDPTIVIGTKLRELKGANFRLGKSKLLVLEADEYGRSFHHYHPKIAVLTNIDKEHLDIYEDYTGVLEGFRIYLSRVPEDGYIVANWADKGIRKLARDIEKRKAAQVVWYNREKFSKHALGIPGGFNQQNAEAAWQAAKILGVKKSVAERVFKAYKGAWRRLEEIAPRVYSDYAHHPTEIKATLGALRQKYPKQKISCIFQPHQQDRFNRLFTDFAKAFDKAGHTIILPIYSVKGRETGEARTSHELVAYIRKKKVEYAENLDEVLPFLKTQQKNGAILVFMSAGDLDAEARMRFSGSN